MWVSAPRGFTLIELLVAIAVMALLTLLSWRGLDGMVRTQTQTRQYSDEVQTLNIGLAQWRADLDALLPLATSPGAAPAAGQLARTLDWNGQTLRLARTSPKGYGSAADSGVQVVAWSRRDVAGTVQWLRWQSAVLRNRSELTDAWEQAARWAQNPSEQDKKNETAIAPLLQWQIFYFRGDAWSNPLSSANTNTAPNAAPDTRLPDGVRLVLTLPNGLAINGTLTLDWVRPIAVGAKS